MKTHTSNSKRLIAIAFFSLASAAAAQQGTPAASEARAGAWLAIQSSSQMASKVPQVATDLERDKAVERFLKTYDNPIPDSYYGLKFGSKGN